MLQDRHKNFVESRIRHIDFELVSLSHVLYCGSLKANNFNLSFAVTKYVAVDNTFALI